MVSKSCRSRRPALRLHGPTCRSDLDRQIETQPVDPEEECDGAAVSAATFSPRVPVVCVILGTNFPDALGAAAAAAHLGGPVLLVTTGSIPAETAAELTRLKPGRIVVAGGATVVSDSVLAALQAF